MFSVGKKEKDTYAIGDLICTDDLFLLLNYNKWIERQVYMIIGCHVIDEEIAEISFLGQWRDLNSPIRTYVLSRAIGSDPNSISPFLVRSFRKIG